MTLKVIPEEDRLRRMTVNPETQLIWSRIMSHNIQVLLSLVLLTQVNISIQDTLSTRIQRLHEFLAKRREDHSESAAAVLGVVEAFEVGFLNVLLSENLAGKNDETSAFHGDNMGEGLAAFGRDMMGPVFTDRWEEGGPAGDVDVDILGVFVVAEEGLSVFPAV